MEHGEKESLIYSAWLPACAYIYILICIFDFIIMPITIEVHATSRINSVLDKANEEYNHSKDSAAYIDTIKNAKLFDGQWNPLTLQGAGLFHLAFGALLAGGSVTRGFVKKAKVEGEFQVALNNITNGNGNGAPK